MPRTTHPFWVGRINEQCSNFPTRSAQQIADELLKVPLHEIPSGAGRPPLTRSVADYKAKYRDLEPSEQLEYRYLRWPDCCIAGLFPWEWSSVLLRLLRHLAETGRAEQPVTIPTARWFCRLWLAAADANAPVGEFAEMAGMISSLERQNMLLKPFPFASELQWHMAFQRWTEEGEASFIRAREEHPGHSIPWGAMHPQALRIHLRRAPAYRQFEGWLDWEAADLSTQDGERNLRQRHQSPTAPHDEEGPF